MLAGLSMVPTPVRLFFSMHAECTTTKHCLAAANVIRPAPFGRLRPEALRGRRSSSRSLVIYPPFPHLAPRSASRAHLRFVESVGPNSCDSSPSFRSAQTDLTICPRLSAGYAVPLFAIFDSPLRRHFGVHNNGVKPKPLGFSAGSIRFSPGIPES